MGRRERDQSRFLDYADFLEIERRVAGGETYDTAAAAVGCSTKSIQRFMARTGGVVRKKKARSPLRLCLREREDLSRGLVAGRPVYEIAAELGRAPSTIYRELALNGGRKEYRACRAEASARERARRPKPSKLTIHRRLRLEVERGLVNYWSPEQIARQLVVDYPEEPQMRVSHETIYRSLFVQARGTLRKELTAHLRTRRTRRRTHQRSARSGQGQLQNTISIRERPAEAADRAVPGHWEGDLIIGSRGRSAIGVLVERASRYVVLLHLPHGRSAEEFRLALTKQFGAIPVELRRTLTWDQGKEMAEHVKFSLATDTQVYFCDPHSPWQRGSNENTNGLLRQFFPRTADLSVYSKAHLNRVARLLNGRPRQTLGWMKPCHVFARSVASMG